MLSSKFTTAIISFIALFALTINAEDAYNYVELRCDKNHGEEWVEGWNEAAYNGDSICEIVSWPGDSWSGFYVAQNCTLKTFNTEFETYKKQLNETALQGNCMVEFFNDDKVYNTFNTTITFVYELPEPEPFKTQADDDEVPAEVRHAVDNVFNSFYLPGQKCISDKWVIDPASFTNTSVTVVVDLIDAKSCNKKNFENIIKKQLKDNEYLKSVKVAEFNNAFTMTMPIAIFAVAAIAMAFF